MENFDKKMQRLIQEKKFEEAAKLLNEQQGDFWMEKYPKMTLEQKINYWSGSLHQQMRWNGESGFDEMAVFSKADYELWKQHEPRIDSLLPAILEKLNVNRENALALLFPEE
ncbi:MAG: hypothetical protein IAE84_04160 [Saprospiraceae bacterium]|nr:hypothetical protein [Saprospiraceae bacterium]